MLVADLVERRDLLAGEAPGLGQYGIDQILAEVAEDAGIEGGPQAGHLLQREGYVSDRRLVHADIPPPPTVFPVACRQSAGRNPIPSFT